MASEGAGILLEMFGFDKLIHEVVQIFTLFCSVLMLLMIGAMSSLFTPIRISFDRL